MPIKQQYLYLRQVIQCPQLVARKLQCANMFAYFFFFVVLVIVSKIYEFNRLGSVVNCSL